eukprot:5845068-Amphidinium_carterae.1
MVLKRQEFDDFVNVRVYNISKKLGRKRVPLEQHLATLALVVHPLSSSGSVLCTWYEDFKGSRISWASMAARDINAR